MIEQERYITNMARVWVSIKFRRKINNGYIPKGLWAGKETIGSASVQYFCYRKITKTIVLSHGSQTPTSLQKPILDF